MELLQEGSCKITSKRSCKKRRGNFEDFKFDRALLHSRKRQDSEIRDQFIEKHETREYTVSRNKWFSKALAE